MYVCVCVCVRERERERVGEKSKSPNLMRITTFAKKDEEPSSSFLAQEMRKIEEAVG